jgi:hypothetical protein
MARRKPPGQGKTRTREHVVADLAVNHVERQALLGDGTVERVIRDYGLDLMLFTFTPAGELEGGTILLQVKGTERLTWQRGQARASFRIERRDLIGWLRQLLPVILIVYDATEDRAYWLHVQGHIAAQPGFNIFAAGEKVTVHLDARQALTPATIRHLADLRDGVGER